MRERLPSFLILQITTGQKLRMGSDLLTITQFLAAAESGLQGKSSQSSFSRPLLFIGL